MNRRDALVAFLALGSLGVPVGAYAQSVPPRRPMRIGLLPNLGEGYRKMIAMVMGEFGWSEGRDFSFIGLESEYRTEQLDASATRLVKDNPDLIFVLGDGLAVTARRYTSTIPIVMWVSGYPVEAGLAESLSRPGNNVTGNSYYVGYGVWGKFIQLLHEVKPGTKRISVLIDYVPPFTTREITEGVLGEMKLAAGRYGISLHIAEVVASDKVEAGLTVIGAARPHALIATTGPGNWTSKQRIVEFALSKRIPLIVDGPWGLPPDKSPTLVYSPRSSDLMRSAVSYVDRILRGAKPGDLPIQQPAKFELVLNSKIAKTIGLTVPQSFMLQVDSIIE